MINMVVVLTATQPIYATAPQSATITATASLLGEVITVDVAIGGAAVIACAALAVRTRLAR